MTKAELNEMGCKANEENPLNSIMWKPSAMVTKYHALFYVTVIFLHLIPGLLIDGLIKLSGSKPLYVHIRGCIKKLRDWTYRLECI